MKQHFVLVSQKLCIQLSWKGVVSVSKMDFKMHEYTHVVVGKVTPALRVTDRADLNDARRQHDCFLRLLRELNLEVVEVDLGYSFPENVVLEHIAVVCHGIALLMKPTTSMEDDMVRFFCWFCITLG